MTTALENINVRRMLNHVEKQTRAALEGRLKGFEGQTDDAVARATMAAQMNEMYAKMGLADTFSATVLPPVMERTEQHTLKTLPPETDGTIQMGDGDGPEIITETKIIETNPKPGELQVSIQVKQPIGFINLDIQVPKEPT